MKLLLGVSENLSAFMTTMVMTYCKEGSGLSPCARVHMRGHVGGYLGVMRSIVGRRAEIK